MPTTEARVPNTELIRLREDAGLSQQDLADELNDLAASAHGKHPMLTRKTIGRWERGEVTWPQPFYRRLLAERLGIAADELGFHRPKRTQPHQTKPAPDSLELATPPTGVEPRVESDQQQWRDVRAALGTRRRELAVLAEDLYPNHRIDGLANTGVISTPAWIPDTPVPFERISLEFDAAGAEPIVAGSEPASAAIRPLATDESRYRRYHDAVRDLAPPTLFENRLCFRIVNVDWSLPTLAFGEMGFFDAVDTNEALAHETALHHLALDRDGDTVQPRASWRRLTFRKLVDDPFDLTRRPLMGAVGTLTIRGGESPSIILHQRDADRVAGGGGLLHLLPAGIFQPSSVLPAAIAEDFSLWRNIQREYAEELLGHTEYDGSGRPINYAAVEPFATMDRARSDSRIRLFALGITLDALTLAADILTVAVIEPNLYDDLFGDAVDVNAEGLVPARRLPFEENTLAWLRESRRLSPGAAAALHLAWQHRRTILGCRTTHVIRP